MLVPPVTHKSDLEYNFTQIFIIRRCKHGNLSHLSSTAHDMNTMLLGFTHLKFSLQMTGWYNLSKVWSELGVVEAMFLSLFP